MIEPSVWFWLLLVMAIFIAITAGRIMKCFYDIKKIENILKEDEKQWREFEKREDNNNE